MFELTQNRKYLLGAGGAIYLGLVITFFIKLNQLNNILIESNYGSWELVQFNSYQPVKYFFLCFLLIIFSVAGIIYFASCLIRKELEFIEIILFIILIIIFLISIVLAIKLIAIPIFQAILGVTVVSCIVAFGALNSN